MISASVTTTAVTLPARAGIDGVLEEVFPADRAAVIPASSRINRLDHAQPVTRLTDRGHPPFGLSAASGTPVRACRCFRFLPRILVTSVDAFLAEMIVTSR